MPDYAPWDVEPDPIPEPHLVTLEYKLTAYVTVDIANGWVTHQTLYSELIDPVATDGVSTNEFADAVRVVETTEYDWPGWDWS